MEGLLSTGPSLSSFITGYVISEALDLVVPITCMRITYQLNHLITGSVCTAAVACA